MKRSNLEFAWGLARKAENDLKSASVGLEHDAPLDTVCFHIQQTAEKLIKALLSWQGAEYRLTHDLKDLLDLAIPRFPALAEFRGSLPDYTDFAVAMRYDDSMYPTREETAEALETVLRLRAIVYALLPPEAHP